MKLRAFALAAGAAAPLLLHCSSSDDSSSRHSNKGEACQVTSDCGDGLACQPLPGGVTGVCVSAAFNIAPTAKECVISECSVAADCCPAPPSDCSTLLQLCGDAGKGNPACDEYEQRCKCDTTKHDCVNDRCITHCGADPECAVLSDARKCVAGNCVQCAIDSDCTGTGATCVDGKCQRACIGDGDCAGFQRCLAQKCVESGCQTDRECVAATRDIDAKCGTDGRCLVSCKSDLECGSPKSYSFFSCIDSKCIYTGCQTDKDCRLLLTGPSDASIIGATEHVFCRDKTTAGP